MSKTPKKTLVNIIDDSKSIKLALDQLSANSREFGSGENGLWRDWVGFWPIVQPLIEAYRSHNNEAIIHALYQRESANEKKTMLKELVIRIIRHPEVFGLKELKKSHVITILKEIYPDKLEVFPTSQRQQTAWWTEIGLPIKQSRERENPVFLKRIAEIKANNTDGTPNYGAKSWEQYYEILQRVRALGDDPDSSEIQIISDDVLGVKSNNLKPEDRNSSNYRAYWTSMTEDEDPFR